MCGILTIQEFWARCKESVVGLPHNLPEAWAFGATPEQADHLLELVLSGTKTATSSPLWDYECAGEYPPAEGDYSIILDGKGEPRALLKTIAVSVVPFHLVTKEHAYAEGERERTLASWREIHEWFWREHSENPRGYEPTMPVVCERFRVVVPTAQNVAQGSVQ